MLMNIQRLFMNIYQLFMNIQRMFTNIWLIFLHFNKNITLSKNENNEIRNTNALIFSYFVQIHISQIGSLTKNLTTQKFIIGNQVVIGSSQKFVFRRGKV